MDLYGGSSDLLRCQEEAHDFLLGGATGLRMLVNNAGYKERREGDRTRYGQGLRAQRAVICDLRVSIAMQVICFMYLVYK